MKYMLLKVSMVKKLLEKELERASKPTFRIEKIIKKNSDR